MNKITQEEVTIALSIIVLVENLLPSIEENIGLNVVELDSVVHLLHNLSSHSVSLEKAILETQKKSGLPIEILHKNLKKYKILFSYVVFKSLSQESETRRTLGKFAIHNMPKAVEILYRLDEQLSNYLKQD